MKKPKLVCFDLNKTLIKENSWLNLNLALGVTIDEDNMLMKWSEEGIIDDATGQKLIGNIYRVRKQPTRDDMMRILKAYTYLDDAESTILSLQKYGYEIAIISGSMDILVEHVASELGVSHWAANNVFKFDDDEFIGIETIENDDDYKVHQAEHFAELLGIDMDEITAIGDGDNDKKLFESVGRSITLQGSKIANSATYTVAKLSEIPSILTD